MKVIGSKSKGKEKVNLTLSLSHFTYYFKLLSDSRVTWHQVLLELPRLRQVDHQSEEGLNMNKINYNARQFTDQY